MSKSLAFSIGLVALGLSGCGSYLQNFTCASQDLTKLEEAAKGFTGAGPTVTRTDAAAHAFAREMNEKLASQCPAPVLTACSPGNTVVVRSNDRILGPVISFGVDATTKLRERWTHDGLARVKEYSISYSTSINGNQFRATLACFKNATK